MSEAMSEGAQARVDALLRRGMIFSILWLAGFGSAVAVVNALRARRLINASGGALLGMGRVWWCLIVGSIGVILWTPIVLVVIVNQFRP